MNEDKSVAIENPQTELDNDADKQATADKKSPINSKMSESGGPQGPEPTRYGDWERKGRCVDF